MAEAAFVARCGTTRIDLNQVSDWNDKNMDRAQSKDEFRYKDRYFKDKEWACYQDLLEKTGTKTDPAYHLSIPSAFTSTNKDGIKQLLSVYSTQFDKGSLKLSLTRHMREGAGCIGDSRYSIVLSALKNGKPISISGVSKKIRHQKPESSSGDMWVSYKNPKHTSSSDAQCVKKVEELLKALVRANP